MIDLTPSPDQELREILNKQLLMEALHGGDVEYILTTPDYRDQNDQFLFDINCNDVFGHTPLHYAVKNGSLENVTHIIEAEGCDVDPQNWDGDTPLHIAVQIEDRDIRHKMVTLLVKEAGATDSINMRNTDGRTPNDVAKIFFPDDEEVIQLTTKPARTVDAIIGKDDIASDGEGDGA